MSSVESLGIKCFLCLKEDDVKKFSVKILNKCLNTLKIRKENQFRYKDVEIPSEPNDSVGYHSRPCYANFTALGKNQKQSLVKIEVKTENFQDVESEILQADDGSTDNLQLTHNYTNNLNMCIFCEKLFRHIKNRHHTLSVTTEYNTMDKIKDFATKTNDLKLLQNIHSCINNNKPIKYHRICKNNYNSAITATQRHKTNWHAKRNHFKIALKNLCIFIEYYIIRQGNRCFLDFLLELFLDYLVQSYDDPHIDKYSFSTGHIPEQIKNKFGKDIRIISKPHQRKIVAPRIGDLETIDMQQLTETDIILRSALMLRKSILKINPAKITDNITAVDLIRGECELPEAVISFFTTFLAGHNPKQRESSRTTRLVKSFGADAIYAITHGKIKPSKHITLGSAIKSLTSSKKVIDVLHRYGHICSYDTIRFLETEVTCTLSERSNSGSVIREKNLCAFTGNECNEKVTIKDTMGIGIKDEITTDKRVSADIDLLAHRNGFAADVKLENPEQISNSSNDAVLSSKKRKINYRGVIADIPTYSKNPKMTETMKPYDFHWRNLIPTDLLEIRKVDGLWVLSHFYGNQTPLWFGFNSNLFKDHTKKQMVSYIPPINQSFTDTAVVFEDMQRALTIARECNEPYAQVTYDLGMAKIAMSLKSTEKEQFKNLFIHLDVSHIQMALFRAIGSFVDGSGLPTVMVESDLIDTGSISTFLSGQSISQCKRLHTLTALCLQTQEFKLFLRKSNIVLDENIQKYLQKVQSEPLQNYNIENENVNEVISKFVQFHEEVLSGLHGKTAQFYGLYIQFVQYFLIFERSIRTANYDLYVYVIAKINNLFFTFNQVKYARWMAWYNDTLISIDETHPGLKYNLLFGVKTEKMLPQSHAFQNFIISQVFNDCGLRKTQDETNDLQISSIKKSKIHIDTFIETLDRRINPFCSLTSSEGIFLFNISTGKAAFKDVEHFLLNVEKEGEKHRKTFIDACNKDKNIFDNYVIKNNIRNFASAVEPKGIKIGLRNQEVKMQGNLFGRLLSILVENETDLEKILTYPLTPVPLSLCHLDGTIIKTNEFKLTEILEQQIKYHGVPRGIDVLFIDGISFISQLKEMPQTFGQIALHILRVITTLSTARQIYLVFGKYRQQSIEDPEHAISCMVSRDFCITGPEQVCPADFQSEMKNDKFKEAFVSFLMDYWGHPEAAHLLSDKHVFVSFDKCYKYSAASGSVNMPQYECEEHMEANTKIAFFLTKINDSKNIVIRCSDTDILVVCLGSMKHFVASMNIWIQFECGNTERIINVSDLYATLGDQLCAALPAFHAFTGCKFNSSFYKRDKKKAFYLLKSSSEYQTAFANIEDLNDYSTIEKFVCEMYTTPRNGLINIVKVNDARLELFLRNHTNVEDLKALKKNKIHFDSCLIPPCSRELRQHILRTKYIAAKWSNPHLQKPTDLNPLDHGWKLADAGTYEFHWFDGDQVPELERDVYIESEEVDAVKTTWVKLRNAFIAAKKRRQKKSGQAAKKMQAWKYENEMSFLTPYLEMRDTQSNLGKRSSEEMQEEDTEYMEESQRLIENMEEESQIVTENIEEAFQSVNDEYYNQESRWQRQRRNQNPAQEMLQIIKENEAMRLKRRHEESETGLDETDMFYLSMAKTVKRLPTIEQANIRMQLCELVSKAEIRALEKSSESCSISSVGSPPTTFAR